MLLVQGENVEDLEVSGNFTNVREMSGILIKIRELSEKNLVRENCSKTCLKIAPTGAN